MMIETINNYRIMWVVGALERLATLGMIGTPPLVIPPNQVENYVLLDEMRSGLFHKNDDIKEILVGLIAQFNQTYDNKLIEDLYYLITDYKDNRSKIVKYALSKCKN